MKTFYEKIVNDVSGWQKAANGINEMTETSDVKQWQAKQLKPYIEEHDTELLTAKTPEDHIDAVFDVIWTSVNFGVYNEDEFVTSLNSDFHQMTGRNTRDNIEYCALRGRVYSTINFAALQVKEALKLGELKGYSISKMWDIGSKSNWAKFASNEQDAIASVDYYSSLGVSAESSKRGDVFVITAKGDQNDDGGKFYFDGKILKAGKVVKDEFVPWSEPVWKGALPKAKKEGK